MERRFEATNETLHEDDMHVVLAAGVSREETRAAMDFGWANLDAAKTTTRLTKPAPQPAPPAATAAQP